MKKCDKCNKQYDDSKLFCPSCGGQLTPVSPPPPPGPNYNSGSTYNSNSTHNSNSTSASFFQQWGGILLAVVGIVIEWCLSALLGFAITIVGVVFGFNSSNQVNKIGSIVVGIVAALLFVVWMLV